MAQTTKIFQFHIEIILFLIIDGYTIVDASSGLLKGFFFFVRNDDDDDDGDYYNNSSGTKLSIHPFMNEFVQHVCVFVCLCLQGIMKSIFTGEWISQISSYSCDH